MLRLFGGSLREVEFLFDGGCRGLRHHFRTSLSLSHPQEQQRKFPGGDRDDNLFAFFLIVSPFRLFSSF